MAQSAPRLVMVGLSCLDQIWQVERFPPINSRTHAHNYRTQGGGPAATAAVTAARLGAKVALVALHGDDANGQAALAELERYGVDCSHLRVIPGATSWVSAVLVAPDGERYIFPYRGAGLIDSAEGLSDTLLDDACCLLCDGRHPVMSRALLEEARKRGIPTGGDWSNTRQWELTPLIDYLLVSEECAAEVLGRNEPEAALARLRQYPEQLVGITLGERGFIYQRGSTVLHLPALTVAVVDTNGAGDAFHGAYAYAVAHGWDDLECARFASVTAALKCRAVGREGLPTRAEVLDLLRVANLAPKR